MRRPKNFNDKIYGYDFDIGSWGYKLGTHNDMENGFWLYPNYASPNVLFIELDWEEETYVVKVVKTGDGNNFHTIELPKTLIPQNFKTFDSFVNWLKGWINIKWERAYFNK